MNAAFPLFIEILRSTEFFNLHNLQEVHIEININYIVSYAKFILLN